MKHCISLAFVCLIHFNLIAQQNFDRGYIVTLNQDTIRGSVLITSASEITRSVNFKNDRTGELKEYRPAELAGFGMGPDVYSSRHFINKGEEQVSDTAFLKQLVRGEYNLYAFVTPVNNYYLIEKDTTQYFLIKKPFGNGEEIDQKQYYYSYLNLLAISCEKLIPEVDHVAFNDRDLSDFVMKLDNCDATGHSSNFYQKQKTQMDPVGFIGGWPVSNNSQFTMNFALSFSIPRVDKKSSLNIGINYSNSTHPTEDLNNYNQVYTLVTKYSIVSIPVTFQYNFTDSRVQPYLYGGFSFAIINNTSNSRSYWIPATRNYSGFYPVAGLGIQARVATGLYIKADWKYEVILQSPAIGVSYRF